MANTTNLNLVKPAGTDYALVSVINGNMDIIDSKVGAIPANESAQSQITALNNQIATYNIGSNTLANLETALATFGSSLSNKEIRPIMMSPSAASGLFEATSYYGTIRRDSNGRYNATLQGMQSPEQVIYGNYMNGSWTWSSAFKQITSFAAIGSSSGSSGNVEIQLPSKAMFSSSQPLFMVTSFRGSTSNVNEGFAVIKIDNGVPYITNKTGIQTLSNLAYNSSTKKLTFTTGTYITCLVFGFVLT